MKKPFKTAPGQYGKQPKPRDDHGAKPPRDGGRDDARGGRDDKRGGGKFDKPQKATSRTGKPKFDDTRPPRSSTPRSDKPRFDNNRTDGARPSHQHKEKPRFDRQGSARFGDSKPERTVHKQGFTTRPTLRINLGAIAANYQNIQSRIGNVKIGASVKADAYGLGVEQVSRTLYGAGCRTFFVATAGEGKILREAIGDNASIYVLNGPAPQDLTLFFAFTLKPVINSLDQARIWLNEADRAKHAPFVALHIDTGMNRLGLSLDEADQLSKNKSLYAALAPDLILSHLACASDGNHPMNAQQLDRFRKAAGAFPITTLSLANSAGILLGKEYHFQMVRPGISLYGGQAMKKGGLDDIQPVVSLMAPVLQIRNIKAGETIGYNASFRAEADMTVAVVGAGYADGVPVSTSGASGGAAGKPSYVTVSKQRVPIVGRVSMDLTIVDITRLEKPPGLGDWAEFRGENLQTDAHAAGTHNYELLVRLGQRCRRTYQKR